MEWLFWLFVVVCIACSIIKSIDKANKEKEAENLKYTNPKLYAKLKQIEHEQQIMEHDKKRMKHNQTQTGIGIGYEIVRAFFK